MRLRGYRLNDEAAVAARDDFQRDYVLSGWALPPGPKLSLAGDTDDEVLGVAGFQRLGPGQWGAWAYMAELSPRGWLKAARLARTVCHWAQTLLDEGCEVYATPADTEPAMRLLRYVGFRPSPDDAGVWKFFAEARSSRGALPTRRAMPGSAA